MSARYELRHRPSWKAVLHYRVLPVFMALVLMGFSVASLTAFFTQDLVAGDRVGSAMLGLIMLGVTVVVIRRAWRIWPAGGPQLPIKLDESGPSLLKGWLVDESWYGVPWSALEGATYTHITLPDGAHPRLQRLRVFRFVPRPDAAIPPGPRGGWDKVLGLPERESVLTFVVVPTWDADIREMLAWLASARPELRIEDAVST